MSKARRRGVDPRPIRPLVALGILGGALFAAPLVALLLRVPWRRLVPLLGQPIVLDALRVSLLSSLWAAGLSALLGIPLAWLLARGRFRGRRLLRALVTVPLVMPPVVAGAALLFAFGRRGWLGAPLEEATGIVLPFSLAGVILAQTFVAMPFVVITVEAALEALDPRLERVAASLGAAPGRVLWRVTLPMIRPALLAGVVLAWARAFGEFGATVTFAGNLQGRTQTLPLAVFVALESDRDAAVAISLLMLLVSMGVLVALRGRWWGT